MKDHCDLGRPATPLTAKSLACHHVLLISFSCIPPTCQVRQGSMRTATPISLPTLLGFNRRQDLIKVTTYTQGSHPGPLAPAPHRPTCPWDDDDEAATGSQLTDDKEVVAEGLSVRDEVGRHG